MILARHTYDVAEFIKWANEESEFDGNPFVWQRYLTFIDSKKIVCSAYTINRKYMIATYTCIKRLQNRHKQLKGNHFR